jgi:hypothetical protein
MLESQEPTRITKLLKVSCQNIFSIVTKIFLSYALNTLARSIGGIGRKTDFTELFNKFSPFGFMLIFGE